MAGFAHETYDARSACVAAVDTNLLTGQPLEELVTSYRGLGAPVLFTCCRQELQWWSFTTEKPVFREKVSADKVSNFFHKNREDFAPKKIYRAKNLWGLGKRQQLYFVDIGLMQLIEDEMGNRLGELMHRVLKLLRGGFTEKQLNKKENQRWIFRAGFWLLCAKILKDKGAEKFKRLNINDIDAVINVVSTHYGAREQVTIETQKQRRVLGNAAKEFSNFSSLHNLTTEAFGYMYEYVFVDKDLRSALGIHATPSYLVDYIVWQLWPWIEQIPEDKRVVLEPACGHAPFLTGAMRVLRELFDGDKQEFHKYAKRQLRGIEVDSFAREIARLSLTSADFPNPNGWKIVEKDIYCEDELSQQAKKAMILLSNPPFENFSPNEQDVYNNGVNQLRCFNKAAEMLWRILPFMPAGAVFGVVLPRVFLHAKNLSELRKMLLDDFELAQICELPEYVFTFARHRSVLLFGRKKTKESKKKIRDTKLLYRKVGSTKLVEFKEKYEGRDQYVLQSKFYDNNVFDLRLRELDDVWEYCERNFPKLDSIAEGGQGLIYKGRDIPEGAKTFDKKRFPGAIKGYALFDRTIPLHGLPEEFWMNLDREVIRRPAWGREIGQSQIIMNYARVGSGPWRIKALADSKGRPLTSSFSVWRIRDEKWPLLSLWAILNSPFANAYMYCNSMERHNLAGTVRNIPLPLSKRDNISRLEELSKEYFQLVEKCDLEIGINVHHKAKELLLFIDSEVMRLYDLPPRYEKKILDLFQGVQRKGVNFDFQGYYPAGFESAIPLHEYLSEEYQRSTVSFVKQWVEETRSPDVIKALEAAAEAFKED